MTAEWQDVARQILERDAWQCRALVDPPRHARCVRRSTLEIHHLLNRSQGGGPDPENLLLLCRRHHEMATRREQVYVLLDGQVRPAWRESTE